MKKEKIKIIKGQNELDKANANQDFAVGIQIRAFVRATEKELRQGYDEFDALRDLQKYFENNQMVDDYDEILFTAKYLGATQEEDELVFEFEYIINDLDN